MSVYLDLTREFNVGRARAVLCSGQACVLHRLAIASKDGDWILREDEASLHHVLEVLERRGARYRFGAPLDLRWLAGGWSSHFEFNDGDVRVRTDFFSRPPRVTPSELEQLFRGAEGAALPFTDERVTALMKMTDRERDWAFVGELARLMPDVRDRLLFSRSARDLVAMSGELPELVAELSTMRPLLVHVHDELEALESALDRERRQAMHANEARLQTYANAARAWAAAWPALQRETAGKSLMRTHATLVDRALELLPLRPRIGGAE